MTGKPSLTIEQLLEIYARYDQARLHKHHLPHPTRSGFVDGFDDVERSGLGMSRQTLKNYEQAANLPWPLLPEDESVLVYSVFGVPPFEVTWARASVARALRRPLEDIVGQPVLDALRHGVGWSEDEVRQVLELRNGCSAVEIDTWLGVADGLRQPVHLTVRYTGPQTERFLCYAEPVGEPYATELFNVQPDIIVEMKQVDLRVHAEGLVSTLARLHPQPQLFEHYLKKVLPLYQYHLGE